MSELLYWVFFQQSAWLASAVSLVMMWQMGNHRWWAPWLGIFGQIFWALLALFTQQWGLLPAVVLYTIVHGRNAHKWWVQRKLEQRAAAYKMAGGTVTVSSANAEQ
jgi:hypothetical protein